MLAFLQLLGMFVADLFRPRRQLEVENLFLRHQLNIALRGAPHRPRIRGSDRALLVWMTWLWPNLSFPKIQSGGIGAVGQNQPTIRCDVCDHPSACNLHSRSVQVTTPA
jgi:hypothetical protein